ncbi:MAG: hypothetical protein LBJ31_00105 [Treponema sp.]|jgi:hypothetical protein|nr:hypothetical protein [Treponema sp.]
MLFIVVSFAAILVIAGFAGLLQSWVDAALGFPPEPGAFSAWLSRILLDALPAAFYISLLLGLSYASNRDIAYPAAFFTLFILVLGLGFAVSFGMERIWQMGVSVPFKPPGDLVQSGYILRLSPDTRYVSGTREVLFTEPAKNGPRAATAGPSTLYYQRSGVPHRVRLPFTEEKSALLAGISSDFDKSARNFAVWFEAGPPAFAIYTGSLAALLLSLGCLTNISFWSLANFSFGVLAFRGVLALETLLNAEDIHRVIGSFAGGLPDSLISPGIFTALAALILLYSLLVYLARGRRSHG